MSEKFTLKDKLKYDFDNILAKGASAIIGLLAVVCFTMILIFAAIYTFGGVAEEGGVPMSFIQSLWHSLMRAFDAGNVGGDNGWSFRMVGLFITIGGIFIMSALIGTITAGLESQLEQLRKGRSKVIESGHTILLGWSPKIFHIIAELVISNESETNPRIVVLADKDKVEMEDAIRDNCPDTKNTKVICRTGDPQDLINHEIVSLQESRSVIVLSPENENPDIYVIKSVLAITHNPNRRAEKYHIVAEIEEKENLEAAELVGKDEAIYILTPELAARITAQTCRQSGLSIIYTQLLSYVGDELYFSSENNLIGKTYKEACFSYKKSAVMGILKPSGDILINPLPETLIATGDQILSISADDSEIFYSADKNFDIANEQIITTPHLSSIKKERNLILGWNNRAKIIVRELEKYVAEGSDLHIVFDNEDAEQIHAELTALTVKQQVTIANGNIAEKAVLLNNDLLSFDNVILLSYPHLTIQEADAKTLVALLHIRNIAESAHKKLNIVSEMCDQKNIELAAVTKADDFIISDNLISQLLSQLSESRELKKVFDILFEAEGSEIYLKNVTDYVKPDVAVNFYTLMESAFAKNETAIGYRKINHAFSPEHNYGIVVNPQKDEKIIFAAGDKIIVVAEN
jgi:voltage-gated potassium channel Kch